MSKTYLFSITVILHSTSKNKLNLQLLFPLYSYCSLMVLNMPTSFSCLLGRRLRSNNNMCKSFYITLRDYHFISKNFGRCNEDNKIRIILCDIKYNNDMYKQFPLHYLIVSALTGTNAYLVLICLNYLN